MRAISKKRRPEIAARKRLIAAMKCEGAVMCAYPIKMHWDEFVGGKLVRSWEEDHCPKYADDLHEILSRARGGSISDPENVVALCRPHHTWVTEHPIEAKEMGLSK